jgi:hypothetical protein
MALTFRTGADSSGEILTCLPGFALSVLFKHHSLSHTAEAILLLPVYQVIGPIGRVAGEKTGPPAIGKVRARRRARMPRPGR